MIHKNCVTVVHASEKEKFFFWFPFRFFNNLHHSTNKRRDRDNFDRQMSDDSRNVTHEYVNKIDALRFDFKFKKHMIDEKNFFSSPLLSVSFDFNFNFCLLSFIYLRMCDKKNVYSFNFKSRTKIIFEKNLFIFN